MDFDECQMSLVSAFSVESVKPEENIKRSLCKYS